MKTAAKKGSLSLSINAIVVLILAITMLGIGISFTRGLFNDVKFDSTIDLPEPTNSNPWSLPGSEIDIPLTGKTKMNVKVYNPSATTISGTNTPLIYCINKTQKPIVITPIAAGEDLQPGQTQEYVMIINGNQYANQFEVGESYSCKFILCKDDVNTQLSTCADGVLSNDGASNVITSKAFILNAQSA